MFAAIFREKKTKELLDCKVFQHKYKLDNWLAVYGYIYIYTEKLWEKKFYEPEKIIACEIIKISEVDGSINFSEVE